MINETKTWCQGQSITTKSVQGFVDIASLLYSQLSSNEALIMEDLNQMTWSHTYKMF